MGELYTPSNPSFIPLTLQQNYLYEGVNKLSFIKSWGYIFVDSVCVRPSAPADPHAFSVPPILVNPNASSSAKRLMHFLSDQYGKKIITGQHVNGDIHSPELKAIHTLTGHYPAVAEFDFIDYSPTRVEFGLSSRLTDDAIIWAKEQKGIVGFCWHWNAPTDLLNVPGHEWWSGFYTHATTFDIAAVMDGKEPEKYALLLRDIDTIAEQLKRLQDEDIPVLWRPLHEASGGWFWWGAKGPEPYIRLYHLLYERLTNYHGLNNLIWVWNGQAKDWYPGDAYVDVIGEDVYAPEHCYAAQNGRFHQAQGYTSAKKIIALTENGIVPDIDWMFRDQAPWCWYSTWCGGFVVQDGTDHDYSEKCTEAHILQKMYQSEKSITLEDLPDLSQYPLP
ncbi:MAG TPA: glycoside hydrolase family 26 protein [Firmicutes bacterium]|nr:glycoside hydrolase family 26 protein [Bacillota bacterium]